MFDKKRYLKIVKIIIIFFLFCVTFYITNMIKEEFPSIRIESQSGYLDNRHYEGYMDGDAFIVTNAGPSELHNFCSREYNDSSIGIDVINLDDTSIRVGDRISIEKNVYADGNMIDNKEHFAGITKDNLKKIKEGTNDIELIYYNGKNITVYTLSCFNEADLISGKYEGTIAISTIIERPSFIDNIYAQILVFITVFILLGQFIGLCIKYFKWTKIF